jgi:hypothetical protein
MLIMSQTLSTQTHRIKINIRQRTENIILQHVQRTNLPFRVSLDWQAFLTLNLMSFWNLDFEEGCAFAAVSSHYFSVSIKQKHTRNRKYPIFKRSICTIDAAK